MTALKYEVLIKGQKEMQKMLNNLSKSITKTKTLNKEFKTLAKPKSTVIGAFSKVDFKQQEKFRDELAKTRSSMLTMFGADEIVNHTKNIKKFFGVGVKGFGTLGNSIKKVWVSLGPIALALGAIYVIFKVIKQAFKWNIGGIMGKWKKGVGEFRAALGRLKVATYGLFKAMAPVFKFIGNMLMFILKIVTKVIDAITRMTSALSGKKGLTGLGTGNGSSSGTTNNNNISIISNRPIDEKGAKGFQDSLNNQLFYGG